MRDAMERSMTITAPGLYYDIASADYFADCCPAPSLTQSLVKVLLDRSPAHAKLAHPRLTPPTEAEETADKYLPAQAIGNAAHALMIGRGKEIAECKFDDLRSGDARAARKEAAAAGQTPILSKHLATAQEMVFAARRQLTAMGLTSAFFDGDGEVVAAWQEDGLWFRTMIDWLEPDLRVIWDMKTTGLSVAPHAIPKLMTDTGWDFPAPMP